MKYDYWAWKKTIPEEDIIKINEVLDQHSFDGEDGYKGKNIKTSKVKQVYYKDIKHIVENIIHGALLANKDCFGYNLYPVLDNELFLFNTYSAKNKSEFGFHFDDNFSRYHDVKLSLILNISNQKYKGGEFEFFNPEPEDNNPNFTESGDIILFKSHLYHRIKPVTQGVRKSLTYFFTGPRFT